MAELIETTINFINQNKIIIGFLALAIILFILIRKFLKSRKGREYHNEIKRHHDNIEEQMAIAPTDYKKLMHRGRQIGKIYSISEETKVREVKVKEKDKTVSSYDTVDNFVLIGAKIKKSFIPGIWTHKIHMKLNPEYIRKNFALKTIELDAKMDPSQFLGYYTDRDERTQYNILDNFYKTMFDHTIDGMGNQAHNLAEIRDMWAFQLALKDKEIERIAEEKKLLPTRSR